MNPIEPQYEGFEQFNDPNTVVATTTVKIESPRTRQNSISVRCRPPKIITLHSSTNKSRQSSKKVPDTSSLTTPIQEPTISLLESERGTEVLSPLKTRRVLTEPKYERIPIVRSKDLPKQKGTVVYRGLAAKTSEQYMKLIGVSSKNIESSSLRLPKSRKEALQFESKFEGGNLALATQTGSFEYDLHIRPDTNTNGHRQWYYFVVKNGRPQVVRFNIFKFRKRFSLYQRGMSPYAISKIGRQGWRPVGTHVTYRAISTQSEQVKHPEYLLSFTYEFLHTDDQVTFAACIPYSLTMLRKKLSQLHNIVAENKIIKMKETILCKSLCGIEIPLLIIQPQEPLSGPCRTVIVNARTHSGESSSSWVMQGFLEELCSKPQLHEIMKEHNVTVKIVPMLNVDGVVIGNYRTGIIGEDFNRKFQSGKPDLFPQIHGLRKLVSGSKRKSEVDLFLDLHGHSILKNCFIYGPAQDEFARSFMKSLPHDLWFQSPYFKLASCKFEASFNQNLETARLYFQNKDKIFSLTCQNSLGLYVQHRQTFQMLQHDWKHFGNHLVASVCSRFKLLTELPQIRLLGTADVKTGKNLQEMRDLQTKKKNTKDRVSARKLNLSPKNSIINPLPKKVKDFEEAGPSAQSYENPKFRARRRSEVIKFLPENIKRRAYHRNEAYTPEDSSGNFEYTRSVTQDEDDLNKELSNLRKTSNCHESNSIDTIPENFSDEYQSMNDSDDSDEGLEEQEKKFLWEGIAANRKAKLRKNSSETSSQKNEMHSIAKRDEASEKIETINTRINGFREIRFRSIQEGPTKNGLTMTPQQQIRRNTLRFREGPIKSIEPKEDNEHELISIIQKKRINQRLSSYRHMSKDSFLMYQVRQRRC